MTTTHEALTKEELHLHAGIGDDDKALIENLRHYRDVSQGEALRRTLTRAAGRIERLTATIGAALASPPEAAQPTTNHEALDLPVEARFLDRIRELEAEVERLKNIERAWSKANLEIVAKCSAVEKENATLRAALDTQTGRVDPAPSSSGPAPTATVNRR
jgi:hypothetical protein